MLFRYPKMLHKISSTLLVALLLLTIFGTVASADNSPDMSFSIEVSQDTNNNYLITMGCQNNSLNNFGSVYAYLPLDSRVEYQYYNSSSLNAYVRRAVPERLEVAFGTVTPGSCAKVQIFLKKVPYSRGSWAVAATGHWDGEHSPDGVQSNSFTINFDGSISNSPPNTLLGGGNAKAGDNVSFSSDLYFSNERVSLWINLADGRVLAFSGDSTTLSDSKGHIAFTVQIPKDAPVGVTTVVAYGQSSKVTGIGYLTIVT